MGDTSLGSCPERQQDGKLGNQCIHRQIQSCHAYAIQNYGEEQAGVFMSSLEPLSHGRH